MKHLHKFYTNPNKHQNLKCVTSILSCFCFLLFISGANASIIAVVDSGTDMRHKDIAPFAWINPLEIDGNEIDEDQNGYADDIFGWNFVENNNEVLDYRYLSKFSPDVFRFFAIQSKMLGGSITPDELIWIKNKAQEKTFMAELSTFGNFIHGTHVTGISVKGTRDHKVLALKIIPTEVKPPSDGPDDGEEDPQMVRLAEMVRGRDMAFRSTLLKAFLKQLAQRQMDQMTSIAKYLDAQKVDVANGSFGTGIKQANRIVTIIAKPILSRLPTASEMKSYSHFFMQELLEAGKGAMSEAPRTLFVFAAGNDGSNNDVDLESPGNIDSPNVISVAATNGLDKWAKFSNYGKTQVDVAAPGVNVLSTIPGDDYLAISGTSQAAPYVTKVVAEMKNVAPQLSHSDLKKLLMDTVDVKDYLKDKVVSEGVVNRQRAVRASYFSPMYGVEESILMARREVLEETLSVDDKHFGFPSRTEHPDAYKYVLPLPDVFAF